MGLIDYFKNWKSESTASTIPERVNELKREHIDVTFVSLSDIDTSDVSGQKDALKRCAVLQSVITKRMEYTANSRFLLVNQNGEDVTASNSKVLDFVNQPNDFQDLSALLVRIRYNIDVFGVAYVVRDGEIGALDVIYNVPPSDCVTKKPHINNSFSFNPKDVSGGYTISLNGTIKDYDAEFVTPIFDTLQIEFGKAFSRLEGLKGAINASVNSYDAQNTIIANHGMMGVLSLKAGDDPMRSLTIPEMKSERSSVEYGINRYGVTAGKAPVMVTNYDTAYTKVSADLKDLGVIDIQVANNRVISDAYGIPSLLLNMEDSKYDNVDAAMLFAYMSAIAPGANYILRELSSIMGLELVVKSDFSHLQIYKSAERILREHFNTDVQAIKLAVEAGFITQEQGEDIINEILRLR